METKLLIVEDQALIRRAISALIHSSYPSWQIYEANNGAQAVSKALEIKPFIILMDYRMPVMDGLQASRIIIENQPDTRIIMVSAEEDNEFMFKAIGTRVSGIVMKSASESELLRAINAVIQGKIYINSIVSEKVTEHLFEKNQRRIGVSHQKSSLFSNREIEILNLLVQGNSAAKIAEHLYISRRTVEAHKANMLKKCKVASTPDLIRFAISHHIISG
jgi:DNA-binding NarL/FixJ family response regulator